MTSLKMSSPRVLDFSQGYVLKPQDPAPGRTEEETEQLLNFIDDNIIGKDHTFVGPFGRRKVVFCDYIASSKCMEFVEEYVRNEVLPLYSNIYASLNTTTMQSSFFREEARDILRCAVNASDEDILLFAGHGCMGAVQKLIKTLNIFSPPVVFFGAWEHQSNLLPWLEIGSTIVRISETKEGMLDLTDLEAKLIFHQKNTLNTTIIGCFSAVSAITGILADDIATTILLHQYGALAVWDYGIAAPYVSLDMNPLVPGINQREAYKDVMFFSGQKFVGGVQSAGVLIVKKNILKTLPFMNSVSCSFAKEDLNMKEILHYEDNGTAGIVESVRAGIAMKIKQSVGVSAIMERESRIVKTVCSFFRKIPEVILLGSTTIVDRLAIFSIMVRHPRGTFLHHNFICAVLNDMFGIQARGGCTSAESYAQDLVGIDKKFASAYEEFINKERKKGDKVGVSSTNYEILRPGFTRMSLPYFISESELVYVLESIKMVATEGWKLLPQYLLNPETGEWRHNSNTVSRERKRLGSIMYMNGKMLFQERKISGLNSCPVDFNDCLRIARSTFNKARKIAKRFPVPDQSSHFDERFKTLRWFMLPTEAQDLLLGKFQNVKQDVPFSPSIYRGSRPEPYKVSYDYNKFLNVKDTSENLFRDYRLLRQRSESNSPARDEKDTLKLKQPLRERCYSLCSALVPESYQKLIPISRQRLLSSGSQAEYTDSETSLHGDDGGAATPPCLRNTPDLVYVEGVTKELATEIKSELREVIAQVEDVLSENSDFDYSCYYSDKRGSLDSHNVHKRKAFSLPITINNDDVSQTSIKSHNNNNLSQKQFATSKSCFTHNSLPTTISAERFSEYLVGFTSDVVSEMKSELRDVVNVVDGFISPTPPHSESKINITSGACLDKSRIDNNSIDIENVSGTSPQLKQMLSSQDSGINLAERDPSPSELNENFSPSFHLITDEMNFVFGEMNLDSVPKQVSDVILWQVPPKNIWNPTCEAIRVFDMIKDGDRIMIAFNNRKESLTLLHTLHQYQYYIRPKGKHFSIGVLIENSIKSQAVSSYLESLGVDLFFDEKNILEDDSLKTKRSVTNFHSCLKNKKLCSLIKSFNYNVLACGNCLDELAECFLISIFHKGCLQTMKANFDLLDDVRVIRPFVFVRERILNIFANDVNLPMLNDSSLKSLQEHQGVRQLLSIHEMSYPKLFSSLKTAMMPLM